MQKRTISHKVQKISGTFVFLLLFVLLCAFFAQYLTGAETLQDYADNNPELAYGRSETEEPPDTELTGTSDAPPASESSTAADSPPATDSSAGTGNPQTLKPAADAGNPQTQKPVADTGNPQIQKSATAPNAPETPDMPSAYNTSEESAAGSGVGTDPQTRQSDWEKEEMSMNPERTTYQDGFYYEPLSDEVKERITGISYPESGCTVPYEDLHYVGLLYVDFNGETQTGELICNKAIAQDMVEIFYELYLNDYRIERIRLIDEYGGDDTLSMEDNNTSCFNYRVVDGTDSLSKHALGCAIDINPFYNPYVVFNRPTQGETYISPKGSEIYADRSRSFPYKIDENDLCYRLFTAHGFTWGGNWNSSKDYQHFQIVL